MKKKAKRFFATMLAGSLAMNALSFNTLAVENSSSVQVVEAGGKVYYLADPANGEIAGPNNFDVWTSKVIEGTENEDEFEITLQVGTTMKAVPNDVAVVLVVDGSGSMMMDAQGKKWGNWGELPTDGTKLRIDYAREAALEFAEQFTQNSGSAQRMLSVVQFGNNAKTILPWTNANDNGTLSETAKEALSSLDVNFIVDNRSFWDENRLAQWEREGFYLWDKAAKKGGVKQFVKLEHWSDEEYVHATASNCAVDYESYYESFMTQTVSSVNEDGQAVQIASSSVATPSVATFSSGDVPSGQQAICTYDGCSSTESGHEHCTYENCQSDEDGHKHCEDCGEIDEDGHFHCSYENCNITEEHGHCTYSICANPKNHKHCERVCLCDVDHAHCADIQNVCGRTDEHTHIRGCTAYFCQDTTPYHKHGCVHGAIRGDKMLVEPYCDYREPQSTPGYFGLFKIATARCLNSDPNHTHDVYDADSYEKTSVDFDRVHQKYNACGTNMEGGLLLARNLVNTGKEKNGAIEGIKDVYVILLSDGGPTYHVNQDQVSDVDTEVDFLPAVKGGGGHTEWEDVKDIVEDSLTDGDADVAIVNEIKSQAEFYAILYGTELEEKLGGSHILSNITSKDWFAITEDNSKTDYVNPDALFISLEADELNTVFEKIKNRIDVLAKAWVVTDELGGVALGDDVSFKEFTLNGQYAVAVPGTDEKNTVVSWSLGAMDPDNKNSSGGMNDPYIYTMKYRVELNSAKDNVKEISLNFDAGNSQEAVWTNNLAKLQYFMIKESDLDTMTPDEISAQIRNAEFARPSVKGIYGNLTVVKKNGKTDEVIEGAGFTLYDSEGKVYGNEHFSDCDGKVVFTNVPRGEYLLKETTLPQGMQMPEDIIVTVSWGKAKIDNSTATDTEIKNWPIEESTEAETTVEESTEAETTVEESTEAETTVEESTEVESTEAETTVEETTAEVITPTETSGLGDDFDNERGDATSSPSQPKNTIVIVEPDVPLDAKPQDEKTNLSVLGAVEILDEMIPLAALPATGTMEFFWTMMSIISAIGLSVTVLFDRKRK